MEKESESKTVVVKMQVPKAKAEEIESLGCASLCIRDQGRYTKVVNATVELNDDEKKDVNAQVSTICCNYIDAELHRLESNYNNSVNRIVNCLTSVKTTLLKQSQINLIKNKLFDLQRMCNTLDKKIRKKVCKWKFIQDDISIIQSQIEGIIKLSVDEAFIPDSNVCIFEPFDYVPPFWESCIRIYLRMVYLNQKIIMKTFKVGDDNQERLEENKQEYVDFLDYAYCTIKKYKEDLRNRPSIKQLQMVEQQSCEHFSPQQFTPLSTQPQSLNQPAPVSAQPGYYQSAPVSAQPGYYQPVLISAQQQQIETDNTDFISDYFVIPTSTFEKLDELIDFIFKELCNGTRSSMKIEYDDRILKFDFIL